MATRRPQKKSIRTHVSRHAAVVGRHLKDHFIPHAGNGHRPHVLKHHVIAGYVLLAVLLKILIITAAVGIPKTVTLADALTPGNVISLTNETRKSFGLGELLMDDRLMAAADAKAEDMLENQYFAHTSPSGTTPWYWIRRAGYRYARSAENLAVHYLTAEGVEQGWLASASHRKNILNPEFIHTGVGVVFGTFEGADTAFVVQYFAKPVEPTLDVPTETVPAAAPTATGTAATTTTRLTSAPAPAPAPHPVAVVTPPKPAAPLAKAVASTETPVAAPTGTAMAPMEEEPASVDGGTLEAASSIQTLYAFTSSSDQVRVLGLASLSDIDRWVQNIFITLIIFLITSMLLAISVSYRWKHAGMVGHVFCAIAIIIALASWS